jgi:hypothetical protein
MIELTKPPQPWPRWALAMADHRTPEDTGLGDTVARIIGPIGGDLFQVWFHKVTGRNCRCKQRQAWLNRKYPFTT